ncbi:hypothetical protein [Lachnobacterium bovis]|uniref:Uncharacterized protein n=1 Tax=Lachnobacterium bovis TaxID=140626 RepID=A0A1H9T2S1_9FIRM|nr:hypothetical protein [Lachnobacterium bovis]SER91562.1 hypothetical protein SAMN02910429_01457 [Lachnobacterium bovis]
MTNKRKKFKITIKKQSKNAMLSLGLSFILLVLFGAFIYVSFKSKGQLSTYFGSMGVLAFLATFFSLYLSIKSFFEDDVIKIIPRISLALSLLALLCWGGTYGLGFFL